MPRPLNLLLLLPVEHAVSSMLNLLRLAAATATTTAATTDVLQYALRWHHLRSDEFIL